MNILTNNKIEIIVKKIFLLTFFVFSFTANAQLYPVQVTPVLTPPYNLKLSSYATTTDVKLRVNILLRDVNEFNRQVRLKLMIKGQGLNIQSQQFVNGASPIFLNGGTNKELTNLDLGAYFQLNNLLGINPIQYNRPLPDGQYNFCFEVYDFFTNQLISNTGCFPVFLIVNDPPFLNVPQRGEQIVLKDPVNIIFQWTPRHLNANNVTYDFEIREIWDNQIDPQAGFLASPSLYSETTRATTFLYNNTKPALLPDKTYAWRVRAISTTGISENSVFRNNGYSEIYNFRTTQNCDAPKFPLSEAISKSTVKINWKGNLEHNKYHVQYRKVSYSKETQKQKEKREKKNKKRARKGQKEKEYVSKKENFEWFEVYTYNEQAQISNLEAGETYEFRIGGTCTSLTEFKQYYSYTNTNEFTMPTAEETVNYNCGVLPDIQIANQDPIQNIGVNETFTAGDFPVTVKEIQNNGGKFTGNGFIVVPYLADTKIAVAFEGITINTNYQLIEGVVKTTYDPNWGNIESVDEFVNGLIDSLGSLLDDIIDSIKDDINADILIDQWQDIIDVPNNGLTTQQELALQNYIDDKDKVKSDLKDLREKIEEEGISDEDIKKYYVSNFAESEEDFLCTFDKVKDYLFTNDSRKKILEITNQGKLFDEINENFDDLLKEAEKITKSNQEIKKVSNWSVRGDAQFSKKKGKVLFDRIFEKVKDTKKDAKVSYNGLHEKGIFIGKYTIDSTDYKIALYTNKSPISFTKYQSKDYCDLIDNEKASPFVKVTEVNNSLILAFFDDKKDVDFMVQLMSDNDEEFEKTLQWFGVLVGAEYEESEDKPLPGDPLIDMKIVHNNSAQNSGGTFGCARVGSGCEKSTIPNLPKFTGKKKVHAGIDLYAALDTKIYAMFDGVVEKIEKNVPSNTKGSVGSFGNRVRIKSTSKQHNKNNKTIYIYYTHLNKVENIKKGDTIKQGDLIGLTGKTGNAYNIQVWRYHTHINVYENGTSGKNRVNPLNYFTTQNLPDKNN